MAQKTKLTLAKRFALLVQYGKAHGISTAAKDIAGDTGVSAANIQRILNGEKDNPSLRALEAITSHFGIDLGYFDCQTTGAVRAYLAQLDSSKARDGVSEAKMKAQLAQVARDLSPDSLRLLKHLAKHFKQLRNEGHLI